MAGNLIYITDAGRAALVAPGNTGTTAHQVAQIGLATAAFVFKPDMTALPNELKRITTFGGDTVAKDTIHIVIQDDSADQYKLYGFGLYLDNGVLFGVYVQNDPILEKAAASMLLLAADTVFASIDVTKLVFGPTSFLNPPATTERMGVVELATQAEVDDGTDDSRAVTPKTAAARYAPLVRPQLTGPVTITSTSTDQDGQLSVAAASGALSRGAKIRFHGTFAAGTTDTNARLIASIRAGYDGGTWGREYLDFWINRTPNDANSDANQIRAMRITYGGRIVVGNRDDDGKTAFQVGGDGAFTGGISSSGLDAGGANIRLRNGRDVLLRNDGSNFYLLLTNNSDPGASWNAYRPFTINVATGAVMLDDTGAGTYVGGQLAVKGVLNVSNGANEARMLLGPSGGYFFGTGNAAGFYLPSTGAMFAFDFAKKNLTVVGNEVWNAGNLPNPAQTTGITMIGQILAAEGTVARPGYSFVNDGAPDTGFFHITDGAFAVTNNGRETMRFLAGEPNRVLVGTTVDDGHMFQVGGNAITRGLHRFGTGSTTAWANCSGDWGYFRSNGNVSVGSEGATGVLQLIAGNSEIAKLVPGGRMMIGGTTDDGVNVAQVAGSMRAANYFIGGQGTGDSGLIGIYKGANGPNIGFYGSASIGAGAITFSAGGTERARVTDNGKFVVGKTGDDGSGAIIQANGGVKGASGVGALVASNGAGTGQTSIIMRREGGPVDQKQWEVLHGGDGAFTIRTVNDGYSLSRDVFYVTRGSGIAAGNMGLMPNGGRVLIGGAVDDGSILNAAGLVRGLGFAVDGGSSWATIYFKNSTKTRFAIGKTDTDDFAMTAWADDGTTQSRVFDVARGTQVVTFSKRPTWAGGAVPYDTGNFDPGSKVNKAGDTMTGDIRIKQPNNTEARGLVLARADGTAQAWIHGTMNGSYSAWATMKADGSWQSNVIVVYNADNRVLFNTDIHVTALSRFYNRPTLNRDGWQADIGLRNNLPGYDSWTYLRARAGGGMEVINNAYDAVTWAVDDWGTMYMRGQETLRTDGNLRLGWRGRWLGEEIDDIWKNIGGKANAGAQCQKGERSFYFGILNQQIHLPDPWCIDGLEDPLNARFGETRIYGCWYRNQ
ncbi:phage tail protein [Burkholderia cenocepacia]|uniref:phage tail fiber protein n=1 Tax=Burkholderia cenocepacia TaxID=95486 RepID=UPI002938EB68|nr:phage tail protein [Burkholderia cenocepacia]MDV3100728.1 phage tail protein [Burkholderia cenocepacia]